MQSTSAVVTNPGQVEIQTFDLPTPGPKDGIIEVELSGVCGSDPKAYEGKHHSEAIPNVLGHEILGRVHAIGNIAAEQFGISEGDRIIVEPHRRCLSCEACLEGNYQFCTERSQYGYTSIDEPPSIWGGHGEYLYLSPDAIVHPIDEGVPAAAAVLAHAVVGNSLRWLAAAESDLLYGSLLIQGPGPQGLSMTAVAAKSGVSPIVVAGVPGDEDRLELARELGADKIVCSPADELVEAVHDAIDGAADVVVNLTGHPQTVDQSIALVAQHGTIVYPNVVGDVASTVHFDDLVFKEADFVPVYSCTAPSARTAIKMIERDPDPFARILSDKFPVSDAEQAYQTVNQGATIKAAIDPSM